MHSSYECLPVWARLSSLVEAGDDFLFFGKWRGAPQWRYFFLGGRYFFLVSRRDTYHPAASHDTHTEWSSAITTKIISLVSGILLMGALTIYRWPGKNKETAVTKGFNDMQETMNAGYLAQANAIAGRTTAIANQATKQAEFLEQQAVRDRKFLEFLEQQAARDRKFLEFLEQQAARDRKLMEAVSTRRALTW